MKIFVITLHIEADAIDHEQAMQIAKDCKACLTDPSSAFIQPWKIEAEVGKVEEA